MDANTGPLQDTGHAGEHTSLYRSPRPLNATVSRTMARVRRRDTKPELLVRRELHRRALRFRVDYSDAPGHPDLAFTRACLAVFINGCF